MHQSISHNLDYFEEQFDLLINEKNPILNLHGNLSKIYYDKKEYRQKIKENKVITICVGNKYFKDKVDFSVFEGVNEIKLNFYEGKGNFIIKNIKNVKIEKCDNIKNIEFIDCDNISIVCCPSLLNIKITGKINCFDIFMCDKLRKISKEGFINHQQIDDCPRLRYFINKNKSIINTCILKNLPNFTDIRHLENCNNINLHGPIKIKDISFLNCKHLCFDTTCKFKDIGYLRKIETLNYKNYTKENEKKIYGLHLLKKCVFISLDNKDVYKKEIKKLLKINKVLICVIKIQYMYF